MQHLCRGKYLQPAHLSSITITITVTSSTLRREVSRLGLLPVGLRSEACDLPVLLFHSFLPPVDSCARLPQTHAVWHPQLAGSCTSSETTAACVFTSPPLPLPTLLLSLTSFLLAQVFGRQRAIITRLASLYCRCLRRHFFLKGWDLGLV